VLLAHAVTLNGNDGSAVALSSGEAYYAVLSLAVDGTITVTKGNLAATPLDPDVDAPAVPAGELPLARVSREFDAVINTADIVDLSTLGAFQLTSTSASPSVTIGTGRALVDNRLVRRTAESVLALSLSETSHIWLLSSGAFSVTEDASRPESGALLAWEATTDGTGVTSTTDHREWVGGEPHLVTILSATGDATEAKAEYAHWPHNRPGYIWPLRAATLSVGDNGSGNSAGELSADVLTSDGAGGALTTIYTSQGTDDRRALLSHDTTEPLVRSGMPEVLRVEAGSRFSAVLSYEEAYSADDPSFPTVTLLVWLV
jgi:hypothetical protein